MSPRPEKSHPRIRLFCWFWTWILCLVATASTVRADALLLVANKSDHTVDLIDLARSESVATLATGKAPHEIAVSPDGRHAVVANYGDRSEPGSSLTVVDLEKREVIRTIDLGDHTRPHGLAFVDAERVAVTAEGSAHLLVVDLSGEIVTKVETGARVSHMVDVTPDGTRAFVANIGSGSVTAIDLERGEKLAEIETGEGAEGVAVTPDGAEVWITNRGADTLTVLDTSSLETKADIECAGFPIRIAMTADGSRALVSAAKSGEVVLFDRATRQEVRRSRLDLSTVEGYENRLFGDRFGDSPVPVGLRISSDGRTAWVAATQADVVVVMDPETLAVEGLLEAGREPDGMALVE